MLNSRGKALISTLAGVTLLGGVSAGTFALWRDSATASQNQVQTGHLRLDWVNPYNPVTWTDTDGNSVDLDDLTRGAILVGTGLVNVNLLGDTLEATLHAEVADSDLEVISVNWADTESDTLLGLTAQANPTARAVEVHLQVPAAQTPEPGAPPQQNNFNLGYLTVTLRQDLTNANALLEGFGNGN